MHLRINKRHLGREVILRNGKKGVITEVEMNMSFPRGRVRVSGIPRMEWCHNTAGSYLKSVSKVEPQDIVKVGERVATKTSLGYVYILDGFLYVDDKKLTEKDLETIKKWLGQGALYYCED